MNDLPALNFRQRLLIAMALPMICCALPTERLSAGDLDELSNALDFNRDVRPILNTRCIKCHGGVRRLGGFSLLFRSEVVAPETGGPQIIIAGRPEESELIRRITHPDPQDRMPPDKPALPEEEVETLRRWIAQGAPYADHWAYVRPQRPELPAVDNDTWGENGIDRFVLARLETEGLKPSPAAQRATLIRRVTLDLTGLGPTTEEVDGFLGDDSADAYEKVVDRLLAAPAFGERWAAMWLDLARYADTQGYEKDLPRTIWRYRDWLIEAFNRDLPYDQFTIEQLAGDLLPDANHEQIIATAFHRNTMTNTEGGTDNEEFRTYAVIDRVNTTWEVWMGTTFGCVQCHSHPYEPFRHKEYYQFLAFFNNTRDADSDDESPKIASPSQAQKEQIDAFKKQIADLHQEIETAATDLQDEQREWEAKLRNRADWQALAPSAALSDQGADIEVQANGALLVQGTNPEKDSYTITAPAPLGKLAAVRIEILPHANLPGGAGRIGNFVLSQFRATILAEDTAPIQGRYVRVTLPGKQKHLYLAEVEVFSGQENIAPAGKASQISTDYEGPAELANDGNTNGHYFEAKSTSHTALEDDPWWEVDLTEPRDLSRVAVWMRTDADYQSEMKGLTVTILDGQRNVVWQHRMEQGPEVSRALNLNGVQSLSFDAAVADFSQQDYPVAHSLNNPDLNNNGWAVSPQQNQPHHAVYILDQPIDLPENARLKIELDHLSSHKYHTLGHFRLSITDDPQTVAWVSLEAEIGAIIDKTETERTEAQAEKLADHYRATAPALKPLRDSIASREEELKNVPVPQIPILSELPPEESRSTHVFIRGSWQSKGEKVVADVPPIMPPMPQTNTRNRLDVARWIVNSDNPLTARVAVNRFWEQLFGTGIVKTLEDFGVQGLRPSHPHLLDWLALEFMHQHLWSIKGLLKQIVMSATYRQSSRISPDLQDRDPLNRLLARGPRVRLSAEQIRDQALGVSGLLSAEMFGPSVMPPQPDGVWQTVYNDQPWINAQGKDRYRRGLYTYWKRTAPYPSMLAFDMYSREVCRSRRIRTNTPLQALVTLNDPAYIEAARGLARRILEQGGASEEERIDYAFRCVLARRPQANEINELRAIHRSEAKHYREHEEAALQFTAAPAPQEGADETIAADEWAAWTVVSNVLLNLDETLTKE